ncbi:hypothetical protein N7493_011096 [Penicillium malachiteum]|uniref:Cytochrome P450 n=1 Tax=Penicillium malachiteum TaxID=1324776 RepID=A0AAD6MQX9_9EURO|nr:hypothetical protein N7493_011096 [Penicillium malachiteum]
MVFNKVYIIKSPKLVSAVRRNHRTMSFEPLVTSTSKCVAGVSGPGLQLLRGKESQGQGLGHEVIAALRPTLLGEGLDQMNTTMVECLHQGVQELKSHDGVLDLYDWCSLVTTIASTDAVYGPMNPYKEDKARKSYWDIEHNLSSLMVGVAPWLLARKPWKGREYLTKAFLQYYQSGGHLESSQLANARWKTQNDAGATLEDIARLEVAMGLGILSNTVPTSFWVIFDIFSRPKLLEEIREEIWQNAVSINSEGLHTVDLADVQAKCPLLLAAYQETLRVRSNAAQFRVIFEDTMLDGSCLVKKGSILVMPAAVINRNESIWGSDADTFDPQHILATGGKQSKASGFMSFGAAPHMCAGRHFATGEILALLSMLILQFDISPVGGKWVEPPTNVKAVAASLSPPMGRTSVHITEEKELKGVEWHFALTPGRGRHGLVVG